MIQKSSWVRNLLVSGDQFLNVLLYPIKIGKFRLGSGEPDVTLSGHWTQWRFESKIASMAVKGLEKLDKDHGFDSLEYNPATGEPEPHHMGGYEKRRAEEEERMAAALIYDYLDAESMSMAEMGFMRQRLREAMRDKVQGDIR